MMMMMSLRCYPVLLNPKIFSMSLLSSYKYHNHLAFHSKSSDIHPLSGLECVMMDYIFGKKKATEVAHSDLNSQERIRIQNDSYGKRQTYFFAKQDSPLNETVKSVWKHVVEKGDTVVDATCGNGYDTLAMVNMVSDKSHSGRVYAMDIQETALKNTMSLLDGLSDPNEKEMVKLFSTCHSKMEEVVPRGVTVRLVAFNLGYLPGGDKTVITKSETTVLGMEAATRIVAAGGVISIMVYVGHPGGMEEYEMVEGFASGLTVDKWICCKLQMLNRPLAPVLLFLCKR